MKLRFIMACALLVACDSPTVPERLLRDVYDFRLLTPEPQVLRWEIGTTVKLFVATDVDATRTQYMREAATHGVQVWNNAALYGEVMLAEVDDIEEADVVLEYTSTISPLELSSCIPGGGLAFTTFCLTDSGEHLQPYSLRDGTPTNVKFVVTVRATSATDATTVRRLVAHEIGHTLGIARHSPKQTDLMFSGILNRDDVSPADRATLQVLYHTLADITP